MGQRGQIRMENLKRNKERMKNFCDYYVKCTHGRMEIEFATFIYGSHYSFRELMAKVFIVRFRFTNIDILRLIDFVIKFLIEELITIFYFRVENVEKFTKFYLSIHSSITIIFFFVANNNLPPV